MLTNNHYLIKFNKPYSFEGKEYNDLDLSKLEEITSQDLIDANRMYLTQTSMPAISEADIYFTFLIASSITGKPLNFLEKLPAREGMKIKKMVSDFLFLDN